LVLASSFGSWLDPLHADFRAPAAAPSGQHWFGTDATGRDVFARTVAGARSSFAVAAITVGIGLGAGLTLGLIAGYLRGWADRIVGIGVDLLMAFPALLLVMLVVTLRGPSVWVIGSIIGTLMIPSIARITRAATLAIRERDFVTAALLMGASRSRIVLREILPNVAPVALAYSFTAMTVSVVAEGSLSFLGFGLRPPTPSWGGIIADGRTQLAAAPWISLTPAVVLCLTVMALNLLGENFTRSP
jgi:peptide/nickel transport system permease protein